MTTTCDEKNQAFRSALEAVEGVAVEVPGDFPCAADGGVFALVGPPGGGVATFCWVCKVLIIFMAFSNCDWRFFTTGSCKPRLAEIQHTSELWISIAPEQCLNYWIGSKG